MSIDQNLRTEIGDRIRSYRLEKNLTQAEFAEAIDISINFLSEIENGKTTDSKEVIQLANALSDNDLNILTDYLVSLRKMRCLTMNSEH